MPVTKSLQVSGCDREEGRIEGGGGRGVMTIGEQGLERESDEGGKEFGERGGGRSK